MTWRPRPDAMSWARGVELNPDAASFRPTILVPAATSEVIERSPCRFFALGACKYGARCFFSHESQIETVVSNQESPDIRQLSQNVEKLTTTDPLLSDEPIYPKNIDSSKRDINGAIVSFTCGAEVLDVKFALDFSTIQILGLPNNTRSEDITELLDRLGYQVPKSCVHIKPLGDVGSVATVKVEDPKFARAVTQKFEEEHGRKASQNINIKPINIGAGLRTLANRLQMSSVSCTWYAASRVAWLHYSSFQSAILAQEVLKTHSKILDRKIQCSIQSPPAGFIRDRIWSVQVGNLHVRTNETHFTRILKGPQKPRTVKLGPPSHPLSDEGAASIVKSKLSQKGDLESFDFHHIPGSVKVKATATFTDRDQAVDAVRSLNNTPIQELRNSKLFVSHLVSVKYNVLTVILTSIDADLSRLRKDIWQSGHVHLKPYPSNDAINRFTTVRVFGEDLKRVAEAKSALEKLLAGSVVIDRETALWDSYFLTPSGLSYLNELSNHHMLYIHRDARKSQLLLYGGTTNNQAAARKSLVAKVQALQLLTHTIVLSPELLPKAMTGGWRRIRERFGEAAILNISRQPGTITIRGSAKDFHEANSLLLSSHIGTTEVTTPKDNECPACWDEAVEPVRAACGHTYCKECFSNQASSAGDGDIPVHCYGAKGKCSHVFSMDELKDMLSYTALEELLEASYSTYVRKHPQEFHYCPTPDCSQIYRSSADGSIVLCPNCLTSICTTCNVINHDGMTCSEYEDLSSEGTKAFQKWKKDNDARDCPKCKAPIEKAFGCNHMECSQCKAHICWFCMKVFDTGSEVYSHMGREHRSVY